MKKILLVALVSTFALHINCMPPKTAKLIKAMPPEIAKLIIGFQRSDGTYMILNGESINHKNAHIVTALVREKEDTRPVEDSLKDLEKAIYKHTVLTELVIKQIDRITQTQQTEKQKGQEIRKQLLRLNKSALNVKSLYDRCTKVLAPADRKDLEEIDYILQDADLFLQFYYKKFKS